ncbi:MAG: glycosyltransferase involved in cell wall biosynthesis [Sulfitobacter sp.]|jgi:glycosyltransferase involved in cell wall biosynthesis
MWPQRPLALRVRSLYNLVLFKLGNLLNSVMTNSVIEQHTSDSEPSLRIALLGYRSNPFSGGQGIYIKYLSEALTAAGHQVDVISGPPYPDLDPGVNLIPLPSLDLYTSPNHVTALRAKDLLSFTDFFEWWTMLTGGFAEPYTFGRRLKRYFKQHKPQYDIIHDNQSLCYGTLWLQEQGYPLLTTIHHPVTSDRDIALANTTTWQQRLLIRRWHSFLNMQQKVVKQLKHVVTVSAISKRDVSSAFELDENAINVVHNGIATEVFRPLPDVKRIPNRIMATASADQPLKGLQYLLRAIKQLSASIPDIHLTVLGKLNPDGETAKLVESLELSSHLTFVSGIETEALVKLYAEASIVVVPSIYEGFGLPAGEAMSCAVPVISTTGGALPEVVGDAGILVPVRDSVAIAEAIIDLLNNDQKRETLGEAGRARILKHFSWKVAAKQLVQHYQAIMTEATDVHANH